MPTPMLALNWKSGTTPQVRRVLTGSSSTQGVSFGTLETGAGVADQAFQRVVRFRGHQTLIAVVNTSIYRSTDAGVSWTAVVSADSDLGGTGAKAGPFVLHPAGVPTLVILARTSTSSWKLFTSTDGSSWQKSSAFTLVDSGAQPIQQVVSWQGALYGFAGFGSNARTFIWNTTSASVVAAPTAVFSGSCPHAMTVFNDRLFALSTPAADAQARTLYEFSSGAWVARDASFLTSQGTPGADQKMLLFVDPAANVLVGWCPQVGTGWRCFTWDSLLGRNEITSSVGASLLGTAANTSRLAAVVDGMDPGLGASPRVFVYHAANGTAGTAFSVFRWVGVSSQMAAIGSGGDVQHAMPFGVQYQGSCFFTPGQRHIERVSATPVNGGVKWGIKLYSPVSSPSTDSVDVCFYLGEAEAEYPGTPKATLASPSTGSITGGNTWTGLNAADNGSTTFEVTWKAEDDGYLDGERVKIVPQISTTP